MNYDIALKRNAEDELAESGKHASKRGVAQSRKFR